MEFKRDISKGTTGDDVFYIKNKLFNLGMYEPKITKISSKTFRSDSVLATKKFQTTHKLPVTGIINRATWNAIEKASLEPGHIEEPELPDSGFGSLKDYTWIDPKKRKMIEIDLAKVSKLRREICLEILKYAYDPDYRKDDVRALYMWGQNLYNTDLKLNYATKAKIEAGAKRYPTHYNDAQVKWMISEVEKNSKLPASDCSGMEVGYLREHKLVKNTFDINANSLASSQFSNKTTEKNAIPGTFIHRPGHIGTYVGGGYVVEFVGGVYGCQLTNRAKGKRKAWNFVTKKLNKLYDWEDYWNFKEIAKYD